MAVTARDLGGSHAQTRARGRPGLPVADLQELAWGTVVVGKVCAIVGDADNEEMKKRNSKAFSFAIGSNKL